MSRDDSSGTRAPEIRFGFRGEDLTYRRGDRTLELSFTYLGGARLYVDGIERWSDGAMLTDAERGAVFVDVLRYVAEQRERPIVVINSDDSSAAFWDAQCAAHAELIRGVEHTSDDAQMQAMRAMYLSILETGKSLVIDDVRMETPADVDRTLRAMRRERGAEP